MKNVMWIIALSVLVAIPVVRFVKPGLTKKITIGHRHPGLLPLDLEVGSRLCVPNAVAINTANIRRVVIVIKAGCAACAANEGFEERVYAKCLSDGIPVLYVLPSDSDQEVEARHLTALGRSVYREELVSLGLTRTPTIVAIDPNGTLRAMSIGSVAANREDEFLAALTSGITVAPYTRVKSDNPKLHALSGGGQLLSFSKPIDPRLALLPYKVIPAVEVGVRAQYELRKDQPLLVNCSPEEVHPMQCQEILLTLSQSHFSDLVAVNLPLRASSEHCPK
jgi:hypothetical protein